MNTWAVCLLFRLAGPSQPNKQFWVNVFFSIPTAVWSLLGTEAQKSSLHMLTTVFFNGEERKTHTKTSLFNNQIRWFIQFFNHTFCSWVRGVYEVSVSLLQKTSINRPFPYCPPSSRASVPSPPPHHSDYCDVVFSRPKQVSCQGLDFVQTPGCTLNVWS